MGQSSLAIPNSSTLSILYCETPETDLDEATRETAAKHTYRSRNPHPLTMAFDTRARDSRRRSQSNKRVPFPQPYPIPRSNQTQRT